MSRKATHPNCYIIAGPNGAGKTTFATEYLPFCANCRNFINPDLIARAYSPLPAIIAAKQPMKRQQKLLVTDPALQALRQAVAKVIEDHRSRGRPLALWRDGTAVWVPADQVGALHETPAPYRAKPKGSRNRARTKAKG